MALTKRNRCKDCGEKYAQERGLCRGCQRIRIAAQRALPTKQRRGPYMRGPRPEPPR
jgi:hypothetical protein